MRTLKYFTIGVISVLSIISTSCSKDFLDVDVTDYTQKERLEFLKEADSTAIKSIVDASLRGSYEMIRSKVFGGDHSVFGLKSIHLATDLMTSDMVQDKHHHFGFDHMLGYNQAPHMRTSQTWRLFYALISNSNIILRDNFSKETTDPLALALKAEVLAFRGIAYFHLINMYQKTYVGHSDMPGVPIILTTEDENMPREKVEKVYQQIIEDLEFAIKHGFVTPEIKDDADKLVAAAYAAKAYAAMERWDDVIRCAEIATGKNTGGIPIALHAPTTSWVITDPEWLWGSEINSQTTNLYASFYSHIDTHINGYAGGLGVTKSIHNVLYEKIPDADPRKKLFVNKDLYPEHKSFYKHKNNLVNIKFKTTSDFTGDYCYIRVTDPYLLLAEAYVEKNDLANAKIILTEFLADRGQKDLTELTTQEALREEVRFQRAIELWGEGTSFFDMKRWKTGFDRTIEGSNHRVRVKRAPLSNRFEYQIPQKEMETNPNIGVQNPVNDPEDA